MKGVDKLEKTLDPTAQSVVAFLKAQNAALEQKLKDLTEQLEELQRVLFGRSSEKLPPIENEVRRIVEADELTVDGDPMPKEKEARAKEKRRVARKKSEPARKKKRGLKKNLPVVHERIELQKEDLPKGTSMNDFREVGCTDPIRRIEHVREHLVVVEYTLQTLASRDGDVIVKACAPPSVAEGCQYGPGLHAHVATAKCADSLPLHRISNMLERAGYRIARSTLGSIFHRSAELFKSLYEGLLDVARQDKYLHADETTLRIQGKGGCTTGWVWGLMSRQVIAYAYDESRSSEVAKRFIGDSTGYLVVDGYSGYNEVTEAKLKRKRVGCWGHFRRKFYKALRNVPKSKELLKMIVALYLVEREAALAGKLGTKKHLALRKEKSAPIVKKIEAWVDEEDGKHAPKSAMARALTYAKNQRTRLRRFLKDSKLPLDNNYAERSLRIIAIGRKNFLFAGTDEAGQNLAILQTIVSTCRLHGVNPYEYIRDVILRVKGRSKNEVEELLPWNWLAAREARAGPIPTG